MLLLSRLGRAGLAYEGGPFEAVWLAGMRPGRITAVAAHGSDGMVLLQAPEAAGMLAGAVTSLSGRPVASVLGPRDQVEEAHPVLEKAGHRLHRAYQEVLYTLDLERLVMPPGLARGSLACRQAEEADRGLLVAWRAAFHVERHGVSPGPGLETRSREQVGLLLASRDWFVLEDGGRPVSCCCFNARLPHAAQVAGVWTPPDLRRRGYGRSVVAGALAAARRAGIRRAVLFTGWDNLPARKSYEALGFVRAGECGILLFVP